ncbi:MAG TPA: efflux RND transporter permease subunit [Caulobacteraceae bacterium]|nr:efflux RND transporter permease subunit [Caulobacteraceae bacterium]
MTLSERLANHRRSLLALLAIAIFGGVAFGFSLPVGLFPNISFPRIFVTIEAGDRPIDQMDAVITRPLAQAVRAVPGVLDLRSDTSRGEAELKVSFAWGSDMNLALQRTQTALSQAAASLPPGVTFTVQRMDPTVDPVAAYSLTSSSIGPVALRRYADLTLTPLLTAIPGIARVDSLGGGIGEYQVVVDPANLRAYGLTVADVTQALAGANVLSAAGKIEDRGKLFLTLNDSALKSGGDIGETVIKSAGGSVVRLADVAQIRFTSAPAFNRITADGRPAVLINIYQQPNGDTVRIVKAVSRVFARAERTAPPGLVIHRWYDQSYLITSSARELAIAIAIGAGLAGLVLLVFLRNLRVTLIAVVVVPAVLAITTLMLKILGQSFNIMTLGGMAAAIGLIIDDAIVMIEHMERRLHENPYDRLAAMRGAAHEFLRPLSGSSSATILIFLPLAFLSGVTGAFFRALALTMAVALIASFLIAWLVVPILVERLYAGGPLRQGHGAGAITPRYRRALERATGRPVLVLLILIPLAIGGVLAFMKLPSGFMPHVDEGGFVLDYITPPGTSLEESNRLVSQVEDIVRRTPEVATYSRRTGAQLGGGLTEPNTGDFFVRLKTGPRRGIDAIMEDVRDKVAAQVPGIDVDTAQLMEDLIGDLTAVPQPIEIKLYSEDASLLNATAQQVADRIGKVRGVTEIRPGVIVAGDSIDFHFDLARAAIEGVTPAEAAAQTTAMIEGDVATQVQTGIVLNDVRVWVPAGARDRVSTIGQLPIKASDGHIFPLSEIANVDILHGQTEIGRENFRRMVAVTARVEGRDMGSTAKEVRALLSRPGVLPAGVGFEMGGLFAEQQAAFRGLAMVFAAAMAVVMVLLLFIYENFRVVAAIVVMPLLAAAAVGLGLLVTGVELNIMALMGLTMIIGIVTEVAIFYFTEYDQLLAEGEAPAQALIDAGANRLRPIAMTTIAAILALTPLALGHSMQKPLAIAIIVGLIAQGPLVLLAMPAFFKLIGGLGRRPSTPAPRPS